MFIICALASLILYFISIFGETTLSAGIILAPLLAYFTMWGILFIILFILSKLFDNE